MRRKFRILLLGLGVLGVGWLLWVAAIRGSKDEAFSGLAGDGAKQAESGKPEAYGPDLDILAELYDSADRGK